MKNKIVIAIFIALLVPTLVFAQVQAPGTNACTNTADPNLGKCVSQVYIWAMGAAAILALLMIVIGGYITLTAAGNAERATRGKSFITSSLLGLALLFGAYIILNTINPDLTNFNFNLNDPKYKTQQTQPRGN